MNDSKNLESQEEKQHQNLKYDSIIEHRMKEAYRNFSEKGRRLYAAVEAMKLPHGGIQYISDVLNCDRKTIRQGIKELKNPETLPKDRIRKKGGGRKRVIETTSNIDDVFLKILHDYTAGDPMDGDIRWTNLSHREIGRKLRDEGISVGKYIVKQLLKRHGYVKRKAQKKITIGSTEHRNEQFENISRLKAQYESKGEPVISVDTKKKSF